jgi:fructose-bisphosphate aldolase class II
MSLISACIKAGFGSVMYDGSGLPIAQNMARTREVVSWAHSQGLGVEAEIDAIRGNEEGVNSLEGGARYRAGDSIHFIKATGVDCFAPSIGTVHGRYLTPPVLDYETLDAIVNAAPLPLALHGGSGLSVTQLAAAIRRGCAKVNYSSILRQEYMAGYRDTLLGPEPPQEPTELISRVRDRLSRRLDEILSSLGSSGMARGDAN